MPETKKHYVYSARTTEKGLALLNKTKGNDMSWDQFVNEAVAAHYNLPLDVIALPPSKFLEEQKANREAKAAEKAAKKAKADRAKAEKAEAKKAADKAKAKKAAAKKTAKATKTTPRRRTPDRSRCRSRCLIPTRNQNRAKRQARGPSAAEQAGALGTRRVCLYS